MLIQLISYYKSKYKWLPNYLRKKIPKKIFKFCFKFLFLTKKFKERNQRYIPKKNSKCNDQKHQNAQYS
jgi:hypothetical protein